MFLVHAVLSSTNKKKFRPFSLDAARGTYAHYQSEWAFFEVACHGCYELPQKTSSTRRKLLIILSKLFGKRAGMKGKV